MTTEPIPPVQEDRHGPAAATVLVGALLVNRGVIELPRYPKKQENAVPVSAPTSEEARLHAKWLEARQEADRLKVEVDLLKMALEDERSARSVPTE